MSDGARLSALVRLPAGDEPQPAVLEYLPYRKDDATRPRDNMNHGYLAERGYAMVRVDIRGSGDSDGVLYGEYLETELTDCLEVIEWIAAQPWCDGNVGMMGISWGGFNALQVAALRPPALRAIVSVASTVDRYADDVHYRGGCVLGTDMLAWAATMLCFNLRPPTPRIVGDDWRRLWRERLENSPPFIADWLSHQWRDEFWEHGSICEDFAAIELPVLIVAGLADGYTDTVFKAVEGLEAPVRGLVGPWSHNYPNTGVPGPNIGFLQELVRWWDQHLRGAPSEADQPDRLRVWMQDWVPPAPFHPTRPGRWVSEPSWPSSNIEPQQLWLSGPGLVASPPPSSIVTGSTTQSYGIRSGMWWGYAQPGAVAGDQRAEEAAAFSFISAPVPATMEILGMPQLQLELSVDVPVAVISARLCDVAPDGSSLLVSRGILNLTHRHSHEAPTPLPLATPEVITMDLDAAAHSLAVGHRWEIHIGTTLWPLAWPAPAPSQLTLFLGEHTFLSLPVRPPRDSDDELAPFDEPHTAPDGRHEIEPACHTRRVSEDAVTGVVTITDTTDGGRYVVDEHGTEIASFDTDTWQIQRHDPLQARTRSTRRWEVSWGETHAEVRTESELWADQDAWHTSNTVVALENGVEFFARSYELNVARDLN